MKGRLLTRIAAVVLCSTCVLGCASSQPTMRPVPARKTSENAGAEAPNALRSESRAGLDRDGDGDGLRKRGLYDHDDSEISDYGHVATRNLIRTVTTIINRYYKALATGDGAAACALISSVLTPGLTVAPDRREGALSVAGVGCVSALLTIFKHTYRRTPRELLGIAVVTVRVDGGKAYAVLRLPSSELRVMPLEHESGSWRLGALLDVGLT